MYHSSNCWLGIIDSRRIAWMNKMGAVPFDALFEETGLAPNSFWVKSARTGRVVEFLYDWAGNFHRPWNIEYHTYVMAGDPSIKIKIIVIN